MTLKLLVASAFLVISGTGGFRLYHCSHIECDALINCTNHWNEEVKCSSGHTNKCPSRHTTEGE